MASKKTNGPCRREWEKKDVNKEQTERGERNLSTAFSPADVADWRDGGSTTLPPSRIFLEGEKKEKGNWAYFEDQRHLSDLSLNDAPGLANNNGRSIDRLTHSRAHPSGVGHTIEEKKTKLHYSNQRWKGKWTSYIKDLHRHFLPFSTSDEIIDRRES